MSFHPLQHFVLYEQRVMHMVGAVAADREQ